VERFGSGGSFLTGDQSGDRGKDFVEMLASAEVARQGPTLLQVADAVLDADPLGEEWARRSASWAAARDWS
jgi:hypothetical protein